MPERASLDTADVASGKGPMKHESEALGSAEIAHLSFGSRYTPVSLVHELGHAFANPNNNNNPFVWQKSEFNANSWDNAIRRALHFCTRNVESHMPQALHGCN